mgnify:FL=1
MMKYHNDIRLSFDDVRVYSSDTVDSMTRHDTQIRHVYSLDTILLYDRHLSYPVHVSRPLLTYFLAAEITITGIN